MVRRFSSIGRGLAVMLTAGMLMQTGACNVNVPGAAATLLQLIINSLVGDVVFGAFNASSGGFF
ncbi:MAG: hypothetical protein ACE5HE_05800 [Phycisphaerae bacterium]